MLCESKEMINYFDYDMRCQLTFQPLAITLKHGVLGTQKPASDGGRHQGSIEGKAGELGPDTPNLGIPNRRIRYASG
jgi:hypothetical protein